VLKKDWLNRLRIFRKFYERSENFGEETELNNMGDMAAIRWCVTDRYGNEIYLTQERWEHITNPLNHPAMKNYEDHLRETITHGKRKQNSLNPQKYRYTRQFDDLAEYNTHIVAVVLFRFRKSHDGKPVPNNYVVTAYQKEIG
jgi:hypothetical protein